MCSLTIECVLLYVCLICMPYSCCQNLFRMSQESAVVNKNDEKRNLKKETAVVERTILFQTKIYEKETAGVKKSCDISGDSKRIVRRGPKKFVVPTHTHTHTHTHTNTLEVHTHTYTHSMGRMQAHRQALSLFFSPFPSSFAEPRAALYISHHIKYIR